MQKLLSAAVISVAFVLVSFTASAAIKHHRHHQYDSQPTAAVNGRTPNGKPTSFDVVVCGNHTLYGDR